MAEFEYLPVTFDELPIRKTFTIEDTDYDFEFLYNEQGDFITAIIRDEDDNILLASKLVYMNELNHAVVDGVNISFRLVPFDLDELYTESSTNIRVDKNTFGNNVQIYFGAAT